MRIIIFILLAALSIDSMQEAFAGSGVIARQNARRARGSNLAGGTNLGDVVGDGVKGLGKMLSSSKKEPSKPSDPMCGNMDCNASKVKKGPNGLPTEIVNDCAAAKCNKNFRKKYKDMFCSPYFSDETVVKIYDSEDLRRDPELLLEIANRIRDAEKSASLLDGATTERALVARMKELLTDYEVGGKGCLKWLHDEKVYPFYDMEQIKGLNTDGDMETLITTLSICDDIKTNYG
jgi:hypothetical protein